MTAVADMIFVLLVFDHRKGRLIREEAFADSELALSAYAEAEQELSYQDNLEIVLVGSDSVETIHKTHGHYYDGHERSSYLTGV